jgi:RHS repeat-associated protein
MKPGDERLSRTSFGGTPASATFDAHDRMATQGDLSFRYNKSGEMVEKTDTSSGKVSSFAYDSFGRLTSATGEGGQEISYRLDAAGRRAVRTVDGEVTARFVYAPGIQGPLAELAGDNTTRARYIYASRSNVPDYMEKGGRRYRLLTDQLGSVRLVVDAESGAIAQAMTYDPFGRVLSDSNSGFQPFGFAGGPYDPATGLTHFGAREYDAQVGRWTSADPISFAGGDANLYGYVLGDPVNLLDSSGLSWQAAGTRFVGFVDGYSLGLSDKIRSALGLQGGLNKCSNDYLGSHMAGRLSAAVSAGVLAGSAAAAVMPVAIPGLLGGAGSGMVAGMTETGVLAGGNVTPGGLASGAGVGAIGGFVGSVAGRYGSQLLRRPLDDGHETSIATGTAFATSATLGMYEMDSCGC